MWRKLNKLLSTIFPSLILLSFIGLVICYINQWDSLVWITVFPIWFWAGIGIVASALSWIFFRSNSAIFTLCLYLGAGLLFSEETRYLLRDSRQDILPKKAENQSTDTKLRIVTLNCNSGNFDAAMELAELAPDIVFLQECPIRPEISQIAKEIFDKEESYTFAMTTERNGTAIISRGEFLLETIDDNASTLHVRLKLPSGRNLLDLTNVKLHDCIPNFNLWKRKNRNKLTLARIFNRRELRSYISNNVGSKNQPPRIIAGDFSTPPGDDIFRFLKDSGLRDCFPISGRGWGNTLSSKAPFLRVDQMWISSDLEPVESRTIITPHSDHRILLCDFVIPKSPKK